MLSALEILIQSALVGLTLIGLGSLEAQTSIREQGWYLVVPVITNLLQLLICHYALRRVGHQLQSASGMIPIWGAFLISSGMCAWYAVRCTQWNNDPISAGALATFGVTNLLCAGGWLSFIKAHHRKPAPPPIDIVFYTSSVRERHPMERSCLVCLGDFIDRDVIGQLPCGHEFHRKCILEWLAVRPQCPLRCALE